MDLAETPLPADSGFPRIPGYDIVAILGTGGMGIVYEAWHRQLRRRVAVKMLHANAALDPENRDRFRSEAEAVAKLQHPNIIQVFEVGSAQPTTGDRDSRPFIALEFVDGSSLAKRTAAPQTPEFASRMVEQLARAVHAAHRVGVVHRDLKPANVLLTGDGEPKLADFGLAKQLVSRRDSGDRFETQAGITVGTPEYMAPEQVAGGAAHPAIDIYALGVILYELLTARVPFQGPTPTDTMYLVRYQDPVPPRKLQPRLPRDLETICMKCLAKKPGERYVSAEALADDLAHWFAGRPIKARPVGSVERTLRWARRNPTVASMATAVLLLTVSLVVGTTIAACSFNRQAVEAVKLRDEAVVASQRASEARDVAAQESVRAREADVASQDVATFLLGLLDETDPLAFSGRLFGGKGGDRAEQIKPTQILETALAKLNSTREISPRVRATLLDKIGSIYSSLGKVDQARPLLDEALAIRRRLHGDNSLEVASSWHNLGLLNIADMSIPAAEQAYRRALEIRERHLGPEHADVTVTLTHLAVVHAMRGSWPESIEVLRRARVNHQRAGTTEGREYGLVVVLLTGFLFCSDSSNEAALLLPEAARLLRLHEGNGPLAQAMHLFFESRVAHAAGLKSIAAQRLTRSADLSEQALGPNHFLVLLNRKNLADYYHDHARDLTAAEQEYRKLLQSTTKGFTSLHLEAKMRLGRVLRDQERYPEAETLLREASQSMRLIGDDKLSRCLHILWEVCHNQGKRREGFPFLQESVALRERDKDLLWYSYAGGSLAEEWIRFGRRDEAVAQLWSVVRRLHDRKSLTAAAARSLALLSARLYVLLLEEKRPKSETDEASTIAADSLRTLSRVTGKRVQEIMASAEMAPLKQVPVTSVLVAADSN